MAPPYHASPVIATASVLMCPYSPLCTPICAANPRIYPPSPLDVLRKMTDCRSIPEIGQLLHGFLIARERSGMLVAPFSRLAHVTAYSTFCLSGWPRAADVAMRRPRRTSRGRQRGSVAGDFDSHRSRASTWSLCVSIRPSRLPCASASVASWRYNPPFAAAFGSSSSISVPSRSPSRTASFRSSQYLRAGSFQHGSSLRPSSTSSSKSATSSLICLNRCCASSISFGVTWRI
jgi:hypothetical protein